MSTFTFQNETLRLEFERDNGTLIGLTAINDGAEWPILNRPRLGLSFQLMLPLAGRRNNIVYGQLQKTSSVEVEAERATFHWHGVTSEYGGQHDINVTLTVSLTARQAVFAIHIENHSDLMVENVYSPYLGDVQRPPDAKTFKTFIYRYATADEWNLFPTFQNLRGYYGVDYPT
ncbi:MAG: hypothetical protein H7175_25485, partial [Burkholderiales bacterium]|nr:hypothetical protein [Anaerolineae bacterium]